jgi:hypothetical protein
MKSLFKGLILGLCMLASTTSMAVYIPKDSAIDVGKLTPQQVNELKVKALQMEADSSSPSSTIATVQSISAATRNESEKWADFGKNLGTAMISTAKELAMSAAEFSNTGIGKITVGVIVYKIIGHDILKLGVGLLVMFLLPFIILNFRNTLVFGNKKYEYQDRTFFFIPYKKKVLISKNPLASLDGSDVFWITIWSTILSIFSVIIALIIIF